MTLNDRNAPLTPYVTVFRGWLCRSERRQRLKIVPVCRFHGVQMVHKFAA